MKRNLALLAGIAVVGACVAPRLVAAQGTPDLDLVRGAEFAAGANLIDKNVKADGTIFVPDNARRVRAVIALVEAWPGADRGVYETSGRKLSDIEASRLGFLETRDNEGSNRASWFRDQAWRRLSQTCECALLHLRLGTIRLEPSAGQAVKGFVLRNGNPGRVMATAAEGGAKALLMILQQLGQDSGHNELRDAPLLLWAPFGTTFAELYPERTIAFLRGYAHRGGFSGNVRAIRNIPALLIGGGRDPGIDDAETLWKSGRSAGAPWTFAIDPAATRGNEQSLQTLILPWIAAVLAQRLEPGSTRLRVLTQESAWLGNNQSAEVAPHAAFAGPKEEASWLPDEITARAWRTVLGAGK